jgi:2-oxoglutarate ferredoxin oxidoreductase subunit alpha
VLKSLVLKGYHVIGTREYQSNIIGAHSYFTVRAKAERPGAINFPVDAATLLDAESVFTHFGDVKKGGFIVYDTGTVNTKLRLIAPMPKPLKERLTKFFQERGLEPVAGSALKVAEENGVKLVGMPMKQLVRKVAEQTQAPLSRASRTINTMGLTAMLYLSGVEPTWIEKAIAVHFAGKKKVVDMNVLAAKLAVDYIEENYGGPCCFIPEGPHMGKEAMLVTGNEIVAIGKAVGGLTMQTYYPITPASDEALFLEGHRNLELAPWAEEVLQLRKVGSVVLQTEDELSAIISALGAAAAGARVATSTSGPGFALMNEAISLGIMAELPVVITVWMRGGPSTGLPTREGQQDLLHALFSGHGDNPKIVVASGDHIEAYYDAAKSLNWAEKYQTPVVHLVDKYLASTVTSIHREEIDPLKLTLERGKYVENPAPDYKRYEITEDGISPRAPMGKVPMIVTGLEHTEDGMPTEDPIVREAMVAKRRRKFETIAKELPASEKVVLHGDPDAKITIVSWGSTKPIILEALKLLEADGIKANFLQIRIFYPFPVKEVLDVLSNAVLVIDIEQNDMLQAAFLIRGFTGFTINHFVKKITGRALWDTEVAWAVKRIVENGDREVVVSGGA